MFKINLSHAQQDFAPAAISLLHETLPGLSIVGPEILDATQIGLTHMCCKNENGQAYLVSFFKPLKKIVQLEVNELSSFSKFLTYQLSSKAQVPLVVMLCMHGGRFAGGIFSVHGTMLVHKTFHKYTIRKKQGKSQANYDQHAHPSSAGAQIRRMQQVKFFEQLKGLLEKDWQEYLSSKQVRLIAVYAPGKKNQNILREHIPVACHSKIEHVPFAMAKVTLAHVKLAHERMMNLFVAQDHVQEKWRELQAAAQVKAIETNQEDDDNSDHDAELSSNDDEPVEDLPNDTAFYDQYQDLSPKGNAPFKDIFDVQDLLRFEQDQLRKRQKHASKVPIAATTSSKKQLQKPIAVGWTEQQIKNWIFFALVLLIIPIMFTIMVFAGNDEEYYYETN